MLPHPSLRIGVRHLKIPSSLAKTSYAEMLQSADSKLPVASGEMGREYSIDVSARLGRLTSANSIR